jgi:hypothetical protein
MWFLKCKEDVETFTYSIFELALGDSELGKMPDYIY